MANVNFYRGTRENCTNREWLDGQILYETDQGGGNRIYADMYIDGEEQRVQIGGSKDSFNPLLITDGNNKTVMKLFGDTEGGNMTIIPPDGNQYDVTKWNIDAYNGNLRFNAFDEDGKTCYIVFDRQGGVQCYNDTYPNNYAYLFADEEGGNLILTPPEEIGGKWEIDTHNGNLRFTYVNSADTVVSTIEMPNNVEEGCILGSNPWKLYTTVNTNGDFTIEDLNKAFEVNIVYTYFDSYAQTNKIVDSINLTSDMIFNSSHTLEMRGTSYNTATIKCTDRTDDNVTFNISGLSSDYALTFYGKRW